MSFDEYRTPANILNEMRMLNSAAPVSHFLLEGISDHKFWKRRVAECVNLINCGGKGNLLAVADAAPQKNLCNFSGVYDRDLDRFLDKTTNSRYLVSTDENDLEITLLASPALDAVLHELADPVKLNAFGGISAVRKHLQKTAWEFGVLRLVQHYLKNAPALTLAPPRFLSKANWEVDVKALQTEFARKTNLLPEKLQALIERHGVLLNRWNLAQGHDCLEILRFGLQGCIGNQGNLSAEHLLKDLRLAYSREMLQQSHMHAQLRLCEQKLGLTLF